MDPRLAKVFVGGDRFVELGCGSGDGLDELAARYQETIGIDVARSRLDLRPQPPVKWGFVQSDLNEKFPLDDKSVDALLSNQVIEHILDPLKFVRESYRVLKPGGISVVTTPNIRYIKHLWRVIGKGLGPATANSNTIDGAWDDGHVHYFTHRDLDRVHHEAGFATVRSRGFVEIKNAGIVRLAVDACSSIAPVREFLTGNILVVATKTG